MTIKATFLILILVLSIVVGKLLSRPYSSRIDHLQSLQIVIGILEAEMKFRRDTLKECFSRVSKLCDGYTSNLFMRATELLKAPGFKEFVTLWSTAVEEAYKGSTLTSKDLQIIKDLGLDLGKTDISGQNNTFERIKIQLNEQLEEANEIKKTKGKMIQSVSVSVGALIVIILI